MRPACVEAIAVEDVFRAGMRLLEAGKVEETVHEK
jgi:hypothetical protein